METAHAVEMADLGGITDSVLAGLEPLARARGLTLKSEIAHGTEAAANPAPVRQILTNLLSNAVKFTAKGGVTIWASVADGQLIVSIEDTGIGIPFEQQQSLFSGERGLGLAIARRLINLQGGRLGVDSKPGRGSRFWFTLPARRPRLTLLFDASTWNVLAARTP